MTKLNHSAIRFTVRGLMPWYCLAVAAVFALGSAFLYAGVMVALALIAAHSRYSEDVQRQERHAAEARFVAEVEARRAQHEADMAAYRQERLDDEERRVRAQRDDVLAGRICPEWCDSCDEEQRQAEAERAAWRAERARRHGHPNAGDVEVLASLDEDVATV